MDKKKLAEKLKAVEPGWDETCTDPEAFVSPDWHGEILKEREESIRNGTAKFLDWEQAKRMLRDEKKQT